MAKKRVEKTQAEIDAEVKRLREMKPKVRHYTGFGDDNWRKIDVAIAVLVNRYDEDDISERYHDADENSEAYSVIQWRNGEECEYGSPADQWQDLVRE